MIQNKAKFYPKRLIQGTMEDSPGGEEIRIYTREADCVPCAQTKKGDFPWQLFSRRSSFSFTCPGCEIDQPESP